MYYEFIVSLRNTKFNWFYSIFLMNFGEKRKNIPKARSVSFRQATLGMQLCQYVAFVMYAALAMSDRIWFAGKAVERPPVYSITSIASGNLLMYSQPVLRSKIGFS